MVVNTGKNKNLGMYIDKINNKLYECAPIFDRYFYIKEDSISEKFQWTIHDTIKKDILGYKCKLATCEFRGRSYRAYYAESLPFFTGPWKLTGLPGTILEASTKDGSYEFQAYKISTNLKPENIINPYDSDKLNFMTFVEYKKLLLKKLLDSQRKMQAEEKDDVTYKFEDTSIELLKEQ
jgi:GLPGLI family protein